MGINKSCMGSSTSFSCWLDPTLVCMYTQGSRVRWRWDPLDGGPRMSWTLGLVWSFPPSSHTSVTGPDPQFQGLKTRWKRWLVETLEPVLRTCSSSLRTKRLHISHLLSRVDRDIKEGWVRKSGSGRSKWETKHVTLIFLLLEAQSHPTTKVLRPETTTRLHRDQGNK